MYIVIVMFCVFFDKRKSFKDYFSIDQVHQVVTLCRRDEGVWLNQLVIIVK